VRDEGFFERHELLDMGFKEVGREVLVSRKVSCYCLNATIGDHSRIDDFSILKGNIHIGRFVHISAYCMVAAVHGQVVFKDCAGLACRVSVYTGSDDYRASVLNNPTVPASFTRTISGNITFGIGCLVGAHSVVLPNSIIGDGASIGAFTLIHSSIAAGDVVVSMATPPLHVVGNRNPAHIRRLRDELVRNLAVEKG
jgi:dTDP-4-amino-4,6-dideoxy-D-glucose acyltransferase